MMRWREQAGLRLMVAVATGIHLILVFIAGMWVVHGKVRPVRAAILPKYEHAFKLGTGGVGNSPLAPGPGLSQGLAARPIATNISASSLALPARRGTEPAPEIPPATPLSPANLGSNEHFVLNSSATRVQPFPGEIPYAASATASDINVVGVEYPQGVPGGQGIGPGMPGIPTGGGQEPDIVVLNAPRYPYMSRRLGEEGTVVIAVMVSAEGRPGVVRVLNSSGYDRLDEVAVKAAQAASFAPALVDGKPVSAEYKLSFVFRLFE